MSIKEQIRKEIERRMDKHWNLLPNADSPEDDWTHNELCELGAFKELEHLEQFLDTLPEQPDGLEEAAWDCVLDSVDVNNPVLLPKYKELLTYLFKAGAEWGAEHLKR